MTPAELRLEWKARYEERLAMMIEGTREPTTDEDAAARDEADKACEAVKDF